MKQKTKKSKRISKRIKSIKIKRSKRIKSIIKSIRKSIRSRNIKKYDSGLFDFLFSTQQTPQPPNKQMIKYKQVLNDIINKIEEKLDKDKEKPSGNLNKKKLNLYLKKIDYIDDNFRINHIRGGFGISKETEKFKNLYNLIKSESSLFDNPIL